MRIALVAILAAVLPTLPATPLAAQDSWSPAPSCLSDWSCGPNRAPLGLYVRTVEQGGRYVTLEDGSVWEVEYSDRATTAAWQADDFVGLRPISAPRGDFDQLLTRTGNLEQRAAARLAGRRPAAYRTEDLPPGEPLPGGMPPDDMPHEEMPHEGMPPEEMPPGDTPE